MSHYRIVAKMTARIATAIRRYGNTTQMVRMVKVTIRQNCKKFSMVNGKTASTSSWSLLKRFTRRPVGVVSKKLIGLPRI